MRQLFIFIYFLFVFTSCASQIKEVISKSNIKLEGKSTDIKRLIDIDGYFTLPNDPYSGNYMFFEDGSWVYFHFKREISYDQKKDDLSKSIDSWSNKGQTLWGTSWGVYIINNDTIIVNTYIEGVSLIRGWSLAQKRYKVINRKTIQEVYYKGLLKSNNSTNNSPWGKAHPLTFIPADSLPSSDNWLKERKWIWRNESDWNRYMQHIKDEKIKKRIKK